MIYFYESTNKNDELIHPITICTNSERRAFAMAILNFLKNNYKGIPKLIAV